MGLRRPAGNKISRVADILTISAATNWCEILELEFLKNIVVV